MSASLNAPTGAWCSLTGRRSQPLSTAGSSQCTYRCVVLPDGVVNEGSELVKGSQCTYRCVVLPDV